MSKSKNEPVMRPKTAATASKPTTITPGPGAGSGGTAALAAGADDLGGVATVIAGTGAAANDIIATVSFGEPYAAKPRTVIATPADEKSAVLGTVYVKNVTANGFDLMSSTVGLVAQSSYSWNYDVNVASDS